MAAMKNIEFVLLYLMGLSVDQAFVDLQLNLFGTQ